MSAYTTLYITRRAAQQRLIRAILEADDATLGDMLSLALSDTLYNARIVPDDCETNDDHRLP